MNPMQKAKKVIKAVGKFIMALPFLIKLFVILALASIIIVVFDWIVNVLMAEQTPKAIYDIFDIKDMKKLVEIKESPDGSGYYLDFIEDFDEKVEAVMEKANYGKDVHTMPNDKDFLKTIIKAEVITQFPNLGGNIPEGSDGFQGVVDIRRITPDKEIGSVEDNPGSGETSNIEPEITYDVVEDEILYEGQVKEWKEGQDLYTKSKALVYAQRETTSGEDSGSWYVVKETDTPDKDVTIPEGTKVTYTGIYKKNINPLNSSLSKIYVEVKTKESTVFVSATTLETKEERQERKETTSRAKGEEREIKETIGQQGKIYRIAIAAGHNNTNNKGARSGNLVEEQLTIKTAEKVEELLKGRYENVEVFQVGSTSKNPGGIQVGDRTKLARNANPDLCIQIHYNAGGGNGVEAIYKEGDGISQQLAEILSESMASSMGLDNRGAGTDQEKSGKSLGIIENAASSGFPSVVTEGGFIDGNPDANILKSNGTDLCAQGIVNGIAEYLSASHIGYTSTNVTNQTTQESVRSKVYNLKYVKEEQLEDLLTKANDGDNQAKDEILRVYTLDKNRKVITTKWESTDGVVTYKKNSSVNIQTTLKKYVMPYEYLLYFYMDTNQTDFSKQLAEEVFNTEIVMVVQDQVNTNKTVEKTIQWAKASPITSYSEPEEVVDTTTTTVEICNPKIEVTYADTWCFHFTKENSYSKAALKWDEGTTEAVLDIKGKVETSTHEVQTGGEVTSTVVFPVENEKEDDDDEVTYTNVTKVTYQKKKTTTNTLTITYDTGESTIEGNTNKFSQLYVKNNMQRWVRSNYLFKMMENNSKLVNLVSLTKYLMYQATNNYYGVVEFSFDMFAPKDLASFSSGVCYAGDVEAKVWFTLRNIGYSPYAVAGVMGNIYGESGFNPSQVEYGYTADSDRGIGLCQWTYGRNTQLKVYAAAKGKTWEDEDIQIEFLVAELSRTGDAVPYTSDQLYNQGYRSGWENATSVEDATTNFCLGFERCSASAYASSRDKRINAAKRYYEKFKNETWSGAEGAGTATGVVAQARGALGVPYVWGGESYKSGMDCSGLVKVCYKRALGVDLPHKAELLMTDSHFTDVKSANELSGGDIIVTKTHVGIYTGVGTVIHEPGIGDVCKEVSLESFLKDRTGVKFRHYNQ